jgi:hypothetical protein
MQPHMSNALRYASASLEMRTAGCTVGAPLKRRCQTEASGPRVSGCIRAPRYFHQAPPRKGRTPYEGQ